MESNTLYGPLHNQLGVNEYKQTIAEAIEQGGKIECGGKVIDRPGFFVEPTIITNLSHDAEVIQKETFAPIVYVLKAESLNQAIEWNNEVKQGLSSALFSTNISSVFKVSIRSGNRVQKNTFYLIKITFIFAVDWPEWIGLWSGECQYISVWSW